MLTSIVLPNSLAKIGPGAFMHCESLKSIIIPNSVKEIGEKVFYSCSSLKHLIISDSVISIGSSAFAYSSISSIHIGQGVTSLDRSAFECCNIEQIEVDPRNVKFDSRNGCNAIIETDTNTLILASKNTVIPDSVAIIGESVFSNHYDLQVVAIPKSVIKIKGDAFRGCVNIEEVQYGGGGGGGPIKNGKKNFLKTYTVIRSITQKNWWLEMNCIMCTMRKINLLTFVYL